MPHQLILIASGAADAGCVALGGATPLEAAQTPTLDAMAGRSEVGLIQPVPDAPAIGCDLALLAILGYDPTGIARGPLELLGAGPSLSRRDVGVRLDLVSLADGINPCPKPLSPEDTERLWRDLCPALSVRGLTVRGVRPGTALGLWEEGPVDVIAVPPGELTDIEAQLPVGDQEQAVRRLIEVSREVLAGHEINRERAGEGVPSLDVLWPWGFGRAPELPMFVLRSHRIASLLSETHAVRGVGRAAGVNCARLRAEGGSKYTEAADEILRLLEHAPTVIAHTGLADRCAHLGTAEHKRDAIQGLDQLVLAPLWRHAQATGELDITVLCDYATDVDTRRHANRPVPYLAWRAERERSGPSRLTERDAEGTGRQRFGHEELRGWLWGE